MKTIETNCFGIVVTLDGKGGGAIKSDLHDDSTESDRGERLAFNDGMDAIESLVLAHAVAGIDIAQPAYLEGIETAVEAYANQIG
jgi:hypothetical protein